MLGIGSPMHAYDDAKIPGARLTARRARPVETIAHARRAGARARRRRCCVIADAEGPQGIAGDHGRRRLGDQREHATRSCSRPPTSRGPDRCARPRRSACAPTAPTAGRRASTRTSPRSPRAPPRGCSSSSAARACRRGRLDVYGDLPPRAQLRVRRTASRTSPALEVSLARAVEILDRLGFEPRAGQGTIDVRVPPTALRSMSRARSTRRGVARIHGLEHVPSLLPVGSGGGLTAAQRVRRTVADACLGAGLTEAQTLSYVAADTPDRLGLGAGRPAARHAARSPTRSRRSTRTCARCSCRACSRRSRATPPGAATISRCSRSRTSTTPSPVRSCRASRGRSAPSCAAASAAPPGAARASRPRSSSARACSSRSSARSA